MSYLDLSKVSIPKFSFYYLILAGLYLLFSFYLERGKVEFYFTKAMAATFLLSLILLNFRTYLMQKDFKKSGEIQVLLSFLSLPINFTLLYLLSSAFQKNIPIFGFLVAYNLHVLNIALITFFLKTRNA